ncbi:MAG TPA: AAA family ATPase [Desulfomonilaceae bacterium]|nr:AAA family ATPase [Desulfomonilaceae bacterium]
MHIQEIFLENFGASHRVSIPSLGPGLTVIIGSNEAGKSTLLEFVRSVFFGFRKKSARLNTYETVDGVPRRGWVSLVTEESGRIHLCRKEQIGAKGGVLSITDAQGRALDGTSVPLFDAALSRSGYESLFAFDLDQMRRLDQDVLRTRVMAAALGSVRVNPVEMRKELEDRLKKLTRRSARDPESLWALQAHIKEVDGKLRALSQKPEHYSRLRDELADLEVNRAVLAEHITEKDRQHRHLVDIMRVEQEWHKLIALDRELTHLEAAKKFPVNGVLRLEQCVERRMEAAREVRELEESLANVRNNLANLNPPREILEHAAEIHAVARQARLLAARPKQLEKLRFSVERRGERLREEISSLVGTWTLEQVSEFDSSLVLEQEIRRFMDLLRTAAENVRLLQPRVLESSERCARVQERIGKNRDELQRVLPLCKTYLSPDRRQQLHRWKELKNKIAELSHFLEDKTRSLQVRAAERLAVSAGIRSLQGEPRHSMPPLLFWTIITVLSAMMAGLLVLASRSSGAMFSFSAGLAGLGVPGLLMMIMGKIAAEKRHRNRIRKEVESREEKLEAIHRDLVIIEKERRGMQQRIQELSAAVREIAGEVLANRDASWKDVMQAEKESAAAEEPWRVRQVLEQRIKFDASDLQVEQNRKSEICWLVAAGEQELARAADAWASFLAEKGLAERLDPETALELVARLRDLKKRLPRIFEEENSLREMQREWATFVENVRDLDAILARPGPEEFSPLDRVDEWIRTEQEAVRIVAESELLRERSKEHEVRLNSGKKKIEDCDDQILALMEAAGSRNEEAFREMGALHQRYETAMRDRSAVVDSLVAGLGMSDEHVMRTYLAEQRWQEIRDTEAAAQSALKRLRQETEELARRGGMLTREIQSLEGEEETERLLQEREQYIAGLKKSAEEFVLVEVAAALLDKTLEMYELEKQPGILERSSRIFREITGGKYTRVLYRLDGHCIKAERKDGTRIDEDLLSRGTLEQLYLALRLAHLDSYHRENGSIPLLMDDVLVNFDFERAVRTARMLAEFSEDTNIQILFFTCHAHIADLFPDSVARILMEPANSVVRHVREHATGHVWTT